jgi:hypothetical protein
MDKKPKELAKQDPIFAKIYFSPNPRNTCDRLLEKIWLNIVAKFIGNAWIFAAIDESENIHKDPSKYTTDAGEIEEVTKVQAYFNRRRLYYNTLANCGEKPFSDYLYNISVDDFRALMSNLRGMDAAREIQNLYKEGILAPDLGGTQLHRFMEQLNLPYIPTVNHLNEAKRGEIPTPKYDMRKSRMRSEMLK